MAEEQIDWTEDPVQELSDSIKTEVNERDKFNLAKDILKACASLFVVIAVLFLFSKTLGINEEMSEIWSFSSQALYGFISLIIGFYFGGKINNPLGPNYFQPIY